MRFRGMVGVGVLLVVLASAAWRGPPAVRAQEAAGADTRAQRCQQRVAAIVGEKERLEGFLYDRVVRTSGTPDNGVACLLYFTWDFLINAVATELDRCLDTAEAQSLYMESAQLGVQLDRLDCWQVHALGRLNQHDAGRLTRRGGK